MKYEEIGFKPTGTNISIGTWPVAIATVVQELTKSYLFGIIKLKHVSEIQCLYKNAVTLTVFGKVVYSFTITSESNGIIKFLK